MAQGNQAQTTQTPTAETRGDFQNKVDEINAEHTRKEQEAGSEAQEGKGESGDRAQQEPGPDIQVEISSGMSSEEDNLTEGIENEEAAETLKDAGFGGMPAYVIFGGGALLILFVILCIWLVIRKRSVRNSKKTGETRTQEAEMPAEATVKILLDKPGSPVTIGSLHDKGMREMQQDSFGISDTENEQLLKEKGVLAVVADGMGGLSDGERMSQLVVVTMLQGFESKAEDPSPVSTLLRLVDEANTGVNKELGEEMLGKCGSTVVAVIVKERALSWISVGDSHIYVLRDDRLVKLNKDHNYGAELDEKVRTGEISFEEAAGDPKRAALTSYIGIGELELIDRNETPIALQKGDRILLMSDGIYGSASDEEITSAMAKPLRSALNTLESVVLSKNSAKQDNYTCVVIEVN